MRKPNDNHACDDENISKSMHRAKATNKQNICGVTSILPNVKMEDSIGFE